MTTSRAMMALFVSLSLAAVAQAQGLGGGLLGGRSRTAPLPSAASPTPSAGAPAQTPTSVKAPESSDGSVKKATGLVVPPEPIPFDELEKPSIALPNVPIEPHLLRKEHGPFMIMAHTFRGPEATRYALALALELEGQYQLPAYIFHLKIQPGGSNIRNTQPTAAEPIRNAEMGTPEKFRVFDEAAVLVGNCKSLDEAEKLLKLVKKIKPATLEGLPTIWSHRKGQGLARAHITANPLQAAQNLYPSLNPKLTGKPGGAGAPPAPGAPQGSGESFDPFVATASFEKNHKADPLIKRINGGPHSIGKCPGPYTFQIAEFTGRTAADANNPTFGSERSLKKSPLATAADDAENLAGILEKCKSLDSSFKTYVYHDRFRSVVTLGAFSGPEDARFVKLQKELPTILGEILQKNSGHMIFSYQLMPVPRL